MLSVRATMRSLASLACISTLIEVPDAEAFGEMLKTLELKQAIQESGISTDVEYWTGVPLATVPMSD